MPPGGKRAPKKAPKYKHSDSESCGDFEDSGTDASGYDSEYDSYDSYDSCDSSEESPDAKRSSKKSVQRKSQSKSCASKSSKSRKNDRSNDSDCSEEDCGTSCRRPANKGSKSKGKSCPKKESTKRKRKDCSYDSYDSSEEDFKSSNKNGKSRPSKSVRDKGSKSKRKDTSSDSSCGKSRKSKNAQEQSKSCSQKGKSCPLKSSKGRKKYSSEYSYDSSEEDCGTSCKRKPAKKTTKSKYKYYACKAGPDDCQDEPRGDAGTAQPAKSRISMETIKRNLQSAGAVNTTVANLSDEPESLISVKDLTEKEKLLPAFLNLSESGSDDSDNESKKKYSREPIAFKTFLETVEEDQPQTSKSANIEAVKTSRRQSGRLSDSGSDSEMEDVGFNIQDVNPTTQSPKRLNFHHLQEQAAKLAEAKQSLELYNKRQSTTLKKEDTFNVRQLLAMGEEKKAKKKPAPVKEPASDSDIEDLEEVKGESKSSIPKGGIQLVLNLPNDKPKAKIKAIDIEMKMKRRLNSIKKQYQVVIHKVHALCWLGYGNHVNQTLNNESIMAAALSLIPSDQCYPEGRVNIKYIEQITKWYQGAMTLKEDKSEFKYKPNKKPLSLALLQQINKKVIISKKNLCFIFVSMLRALGIKCRVVFSFQVSPLRPPDSELCSLSTKVNKKGKKTKKEDGETSKHFENAPIKNENAKNVPVKSKSKLTTSKSKKSFDNIPQLDGADDRITIKPKTNNVRKSAGKPLSLKNGTQSKPNGNSDNASSSDGPSYWDTLMKDIGEDPRTIQKRVDHKQLKSMNSPNVPKVKVEPTALKASIYDESTLPLGNPMIYNTDNVFGCTTLKLESFSESNVKVEKDASSLDNVLSRNIVSTTRSSIPEPPAPRKTRASSGEAGQNTQKKATNKLSNEKKTTAETSKASINTAGNSKNIPTGGKQLEGTSKGRKTKSLEIVTATCAKQPRTTRNSTVNLQTVDAKVPISNKSASTKPKAARKSQSNVENSVSGKPPAKPRSRGKATDTKSLEQTKATAKTVDSATQRKVALRKSMPPAHVSEYFSPPTGKENVKSQQVRKSTGGRVSHRDLMDKSEPTTSTQSKKMVDVTRDLVSLMKDRIRETKAQAMSKLVKGKVNVPSDDDSDYAEVQSKSKKMRRVSQNSDADFKPTKKRVSNLKTAVDRRVLSTDDDNSTNGSKKRGVNVWCEVYIEEEEQWIAVDVVKAQVHCAREIYSRASHPITYIVSWDSEGFLKDVTRRYVPHWNTTTRKLRADPVWFDEAIKPWMAPRSPKVAQEDEQLDRMQLDAPIPASITEFKNHPLYALKRHLLKFEVIYPSDAVVLGFVKNEAVYARECVHTCRSRDTWVKEAKVVKPGEKPFKIVKARPKWDRATSSIIKDIPLEIFGPWQVQDYVPPKAENGKVPRNPYGNVELFKMCMLPEGTVHLPLPGLNKVARKLNIDCAPAMTGFDFHSGWTHPVYDGFVVCEEFREQLVQAWEQEQEEAEQRAREKIEKRVYGNWKRLIRGLFIRERLQAKYDFQSELPQGDVGGSKAKKRSKGPRFVAKKRRLCEESSGKDSD